MGLDFQYQVGQTPIDEEEQEGLKIKTVLTRAELDELEQLNIENGITWTLTRRFRHVSVLSQEFVCELHEQMYGDVWKWAGTFRKSDKNIGVSFYDIGVALKQLNDDATYWIDNKTYERDELAIRFKHRLVSIHCFPNGNGRHSRLMADVLASNVFNAPVFSWGSNALLKGVDIRHQYLQALHAADAGDIKPLVSFARS